MRHGTWASYFASALEASGLTKAGFARRVGIDVGTVFRWLSGKHRPEKAELVVRVAEVLRVDLDEALAAAGLRPTVEPPDRPAQQEPPPDPHIDRLYQLLGDPDVSPRVKEMIRTQLEGLLELARYSDPEQREAAG